MAVGEGGEDKRMAEPLTDTTANNCSGEAWLSAQACPYTPLAGA